MLLCGNCSGHPLLFFTTHQLRKEPPRAGWLLLLRIGYLSQAVRLAACSSTQPCMRRYFLPLAVATLLASTDRDDQPMPSWADCCMLCLPRHGQSGQSCRP